MNKTLALTLARAKNNGIREGIDAVCEAMALAHYNTAIELELDEREVGARDADSVLMLRLNQTLKDAIFRIITLGNLNRKNAL